MHCVAPRKALFTQTRHLLIEKPNLKNWMIPILLAACLLLYAYSLPRDPLREPVELPSGPVSLENNRTVPYDKPAPAPPKLNPAPTFGGYPCSGNCRDDRAGYRWAARNGITDADSCTGNTGSFIEGCRVYARRRAAD